jgi:hypothetical protein
MRAVYKKKRTDSKKNNRQQTLLSRTEVNFTGLQTLITTKINRWM